MKLHSGILLLALGAGLAACQNPSDSKSSGPYFLEATAFGQLNPSGHRVDDVPLGTTVADFQAGLTPSDGVTLAILDARDGEVVADPITNFVDIPMVIRGTLANGSTAEIPLRMEGLENETVLVVDGDVLRFQTDYFVNSDTEWIVKVTDAAGTGVLPTHYWMVSGLITGEYESSPNPDEHVIDLDLYGGDFDGHSTFGTDSVFRVSVTSSRIDVSFSGEVRRDAETFAVRGWLGSDRNVAGGW